MGSATSPKADHPWRKDWAKATRKPPRIEKAYATYEPRMTSRAGHPSYERIHEVVESLNRF